MSIATASILPLSTTVAPPDEAALAEEVRRAAAERCPVYPMGGATRLDYGAVPTVPGVGLSTAGLNRIVDHAADDMTITVEAGTTVAQLGDVLASRGQRLPVDVPRPARATIGGLVATNVFGPRRFGYRTIRDYLIGLRAVDGRGEVFAGGGRVVKNAAGYDMPRLLVGSLGTLGVITQVSLMVRPSPETAAIVEAKLPELDAADCLLARLAQSPARPVSIDLLNHAWSSDGAEVVAKGSDPLPAEGDSPIFAANMALSRGNVLSAAKIGTVPHERLPVEPAGSDGGSIRLLVGFEGSRTEVEWMVERLFAEWRGSPARETRRLEQPDVAAMWQWITDLPAQLQANVLPSRVGALLRSLIDIDPGCAFAAHAGDGVVKIRLSDEAMRDLPALLAARLRPAAEQLEGTLVVLSAPPDSGLTRDDVWGPARGAAPVMRAIKERFDPEGILNPGRWVL